MRGKGEVSYEKDKSYNNRHRCYNY